jgi:membrane protein required for colicin V production
VLLRLLAGKEASNRGLDRTLGFLIGGAKVLALAWISVSALAWAEDKISIAGKKLQLAPKESVALALARSYNAFDLMHFQGLRALQAIASADPKALARLKDDSAVQALLKDPRLLRLLSNEAFRKELKAKDSRGLLGHDDVTSLLQDDAMRGRLERLAQQLAP